MVSNYNGQVIQISRGNLISRLKGNAGKAAKALAFGELFIHTGEKRDISQYKIHDLVTNSDLQTIFTGDLFAGCNNTKDVYFLGSGGSLKWGGIVYSAETYEELVARAKENPEHIFMYNGDITVTGRNHLYDPIHDANDGGLTNGGAGVQGRKSIADGETDPYQIAQLDRSYQAKSSSEWQLRVNPGDLLFYSSALDQVVVIHLSRSTDALTKINVDALVSDSMKTWLQEVTAATGMETTSETNYDKTPSTLKTFLDGPARHYQYLVDSYGWKAATVVTPCVIDRPTTEIANSEATVTAGEIRLVDPHDGEVYYIPFSDTNTGSNVYRVIAEGTDGTLLPAYQNIDLKEGDLLFALPQNDGKVQFAVVSLYGALLDKLKFKTVIERADKYATDIWKVGIGGEDGYVGDHAYQVAHDTVSDFIDRLFKTKVDVDPTTGKIISSQLPDFLLGAPKYMGHFENPLSDWEELTAETTAEEFAKDFLLANDWENLDQSEDESNPNPDNPNNVDLSDKVNNLLKTGCYWIYQGDTIDISKYPGIFHNCAVDDDYASGELETTLAAEVDDLQEQIDAKNQELTAKQDEHAKAVAKQNALANMQTTFDEFRAENGATLEDTRANLEAYAAAEGISYKLLNTEDPTAEPTSLASELIIVADTEVAIETAIVDQGNVVADLATDITNINTEIETLNTELTEKTAQLDAVRRKSQQHLLNKGDWVIYNAKVDDGVGDDNVGKFEIIDNSSSFIGILVKNTKVAGVAEFKNSPKDLSYQKAWRTGNDGRIEDRRLQRSTDIDIAAANNAITFQNEDKVFAARPEFLDAQYLPRIAPDRTEKNNALLINSRFAIVDETDADKSIAGLGVNFPTGYKDIKDRPDRTELFWHYKVPQEHWLSNHEVRIDYFSFVDTYYQTIMQDSHESDYIVTTKTRTDVDANGVITATGLNFDWIPFMGSVLDKTKFYSFAVTHETNPQLYLPSHSGVLATETYVNQGFTVVKTIINDLYEKLLRMTSRGHVDWLQTIREYKEDTWVDPQDPSAGVRQITRHEVCDSRVLQERNVTSYILKLFYEQTDKAEHPYEEYDVLKYNHQLSAYLDLTANNKAANLHATVDYQLGGNDPDATPVKLNPSTPSGTDLQPEQVFPNHSGILLNNNSVIDGGEW